QGGALHGHRRPVAPQPWGRAAALHHAHHRARPGRGADPRSPGRGAAPAGLVVLVVARTARGGAAPPPARRLARGDHRAQIPRLGPESCQAKVIAGPSQEPRRSFPMRIPIVPTLLVLGLCGTSDAATREPSFDDPMFRRCVTWMLNGEGGALIDNI